MLTTEGNAKLGLMLHADQPGRMARGQCTMCSRRQLGKRSEGHWSIAARRTTAQHHFDELVQSRNRATVAVGQEMALLGETWS